MTGTGGPLWFRLLGPVEAWHGVERIGLGPAKQRCLLALLLVHANELVRVDRLIDLVWDDRPHAGARNTVQVYVSRLRRILAGRAGVRLVTSGPGYRLEVDPDQVDLHRFRRLVADGRRAGSDGRAAGLLRQAVDLWRGAPLDDVAPEHLRGTLCARLDEERVGAWEELVELELRMGRHARVLGEIRDLVARYPLAERLAGLYLIALYRAGRRADALAHHRELRGRLAADLGIDPSPELDALHRRILRDDPELAGTAPREPATTRVPVPRQLPADTAQFTGRRSELDRLLAAAGGSPGTLVISAIDGMAGIGKTALAVHAAHRMAEHYPDGQVFVDLHGFTDGVDPTDPADGLEVLLRAVGVDGGQVPAGLDERAALWRTRLADQRLLVVLDNAVDETQVTPLLPGAAGCLVLVTSRHRLSGLDGVEPVSLDVLPLPDAVALFTATAGADRVAGTDAAVVEDVAELCGRLPLAIRIAAARLRHRPAWTPEHLRGLLRDERGPLEALHAGQRSVTAALALSYQHLSGDQRRAFRRLGLHPGADIEPHAAAALFGGTVADARRLLDDLHAAHLLIEPVPGRHRFHDLVGRHAADLAARDPGDDRDAALDRLFDHYAHTATVAMDLAHPYETDQRPHPPALDAARPDLHTARAAETWLDTELDNLLAAAAHAADHGRPDHLVHQSTTLHRHLRTRADHARALGLHRRALTLAGASGDRGGEIGSLTGLGNIHVSRSELDQAADRFHRALTIARDIGSVTGELAALRGLGHLDLMHGRLTPATERFHRVLAVARQTGSLVGEMDALVSVGHIHRLQREFRRAADTFRHALDIARRTGSLVGELSALGGLGDNDRTQGRFDQAADHYARALDVARRAGHRYAELNALGGVGHAHHMRGRYSDAVDCFQRTLDLAQVTGHRPWQFEAQQSLGRIHHATGDHDRAVCCHAAALAVATGLGYATGQARAHDGLARGHLALGRRQAAREHWSAALGILTAGGVDDADDPQVTVAAIRAHLSALDAAPT